MNSLIQAEGLVRFYGKHCAVQDVSFTLEKGEILGFLGPNGAGKSTTLNMLCGNLAATSGKILINGIDIATRPREAKSLIGYLPDTPPLYRDMTVDEYLLFCAKIHRISKQGLNESLDSAKQRCGLSEVGVRLIGTLSKGFQQRVGIAQVILHSPPVIVLDEPMVGLDPIQIQEMRRLIRGLGEEHGVILSSHILSEIQSTCTRVQIIHHGKLILNTNIQNLEKNIDNSFLTLETCRPAEIHVLEQIDGVHSVECLSDNIYRLSCSKNRNPAENISQIVVQSGWGLLELKTERRNIEEMFMELTEADHKATLNHDD